MSRSQEYVCVLWGDQFEEAIATIFITELRKAGLRVKVVGLTHRRVGGAHGLALLPDFTLEEAFPFASKIVCLIIPCQAPGLKRLQNDPRVRDFFGLAQANNAIFVIGSEATVPDGLPSAVENVLVYPESEALVGFARELAHQLSSF